MLTLFVFGFVLFPNGEEELLLCLLTPKEEEEEDDEAHLFDVEATAILAALRNTMMTFLFLLSFLSFEAERGTLLVSGLSVDFVVWNNCVKRASIKTKLLTLSLSL
jgi:hypothetical protein